MAIGIVVAAGLMAAVTLRGDPEIKTIVVLNSASVAERVLDGFRQKLAAAGWREGENIHLDYRGHARSDDGLRAQARELVNRDTALVVTLTSVAAMAARDVAAERGVPMLLAPASDPVRSGLVSGVIHPGQQVTGVSFALQEARRLEMMTRILPAAKHLWVPYDGSDPDPSVAVACIKEAAARLNLIVHAADVRSGADLHAALNAIPAETDVIFVPPDPILASLSSTILTTAESRKLPVSTPHREGVAEGALFSYGFDHYAVGQQAARLAG
ncbi:MAG TPA: ABC transporter substrate-binding protein, partial [Magnetospirillum sp.]|nr:ABC transporter substrate-binding protein [Magnetospirillum sp.]